MWKPIRKNGQKYFWLGIDPPSIKLSNPQVNFHFSAPHKVKGYADDLSIISDSFDEHVKTVQKIDQNLREIDLVIRPDKCVTLQFNGKKVLDQCVDIIDGETRSIVEKDTKCLGASVASSRQKTSSIAKRRLKERITKALKSIDSRLIRGEYKVWIYRNYVVPSSRFLLAVELISASVVESIQSTATRFIKRWLNLPRNATQAILFHLPC